MTSGVGRPDVAAVLAAATSTQHATVEPSAPIFSRSSSPRSDSLRADDARLQKLLAEPRKTLFSFRRFFRPRSDTEGSVGASTCASSGLGGGASPHSSESLGSDRFVRLDVDTDDVLDIYSLGEHSLRAPFELWDAAESGDAGRIRAALDPSQQADVGLTPHVDVRALHGRTALHIAAASGYAVCVEALLAAGACADARTDEGLTALHLACQRGHLNAAAALVTAGGGIQVIHAATAQGELPLHLAAAKGHTDVVAFLLALCDGHQLRAKNSYGQRPVDVCLNIETVQVFERSNESSMASTSTSSGSAIDTRSGDLDSRRCGNWEDRYAGRTPYHQGSVLLRNSRIDVVQRLLQKSGKGKATELGKTEHEDLGEHEPGEGFNRRRETSSRRSSVSLSASRPRVDSDHHVAKVLSVAPSHRRRTFSTLHSEDVEVVGPDSFRLLSVLGKGSFGEVYKVVHKRSGDVYAMKVLQKSKICGRNLMRYVLTERNLLSYIQHPYIVALHYAFQTPSCLVLVQQFLSGGTLTALIKREGRLQEPMAQLYIAEIFLAIEHLHERSVVYRDLKPENVVLDEGKHAMLVDFGLCKEAVEGLQGTKSFCGSIAYLAPEILARKGHGPPVDIYGLGVLLYECLAGQPPYYCNEREKLFRNIAKAELKLPVHVSPHASALISALMCRDPSHRLGVKHGLEEIRDHAFFRGLDFNKVLRRDVPVPSTLDAVAAVTVGRRCKKEKERSGDGQVQNPFRGGLEAQVRRRLSGSQDISGWEFARPSQNKTSSV